jgi:hypothetical protein
VEIPYRNSARILDVGDLAFQRTFGFLKQRPRINAVVLSARTQMPANKEGDRPVMDYFVVIPNAYPGARLPGKFRIVGAEDNIPVIAARPLLADLLWWAKLIWLWAKSRQVFWPTLVSGARDLEGTLSSGEGAIALEFNINAPLREQMGHSLLNYCSSDGTRQIRLWQSFRNHFRADIVERAFGRRTFRADLNDLSVGTVHKLAISWSGGAPTAAVDGQMLEEIEPN